MTQSFTKAGTPAQISWEAQCLAWLDAAAGAQVVRVLQWDAGQLVEDNAIIRFELGEPVLKVTKGVIATDNPDGVHSVILAALRNTGE